MTRHRVLHSIPLRLRPLLLTWTAVAVFFALQNAIGGIARGRGIDWQWDVIHELIYWGLWGLATPLIARQAARYWLEPGSGIGPWLAHALSAALLSPAQVFCTYVLTGLVRAATTPLTLRDVPAWVAGLRMPAAIIAITGFIYYWMILAALYAVAYRWLYQAQRRQTARAQLDALRAQLHPHFLFNALNSISVLTEEDPARANRMLIRLSDLLRTVLRRNDDHEVPLEEELAFLRSYLEIQRLRFEERLTVNIDVDDEARTAFVPVMVLQPLVENAVRYAVEPQREGGRVSVRARRVAEQLLLEVCDDGPGLGSEREHHSGIGLANTRARLEGLYGAAQELRLEAAKGGGLAVRIRIPWRTKA